MSQSPCFAETERSRTEVMNQLISERVRAALDQHFGSGTGAPITAEVAAGRVVLTGAMADGKDIAEAVRLVSAVEGVTGVESRIVPLGFHPMEYS